MKNEHRQSNINNTKASATEEKRIVRNLSLVSILGNTLLFGLKMMAGVAGHSGAMISDAVHSLSDVLTTIVAYFGVKLSKRAADRRHPYGHERLECVASLFLGVMLAMTGFGIGYAGLKNIFAGNYETLTVPGGIALLAAVVSIVSKEAMYWYTRYYAKKIDSAAFMADAWHHRSDAFSSVGSLFGIGGAMIGFPVLDSVASVVICMFILKISLDVFRDSISKMLDTACEETYEKALRECIEGHSEVVCVDMLHTRKFGNKVYTDLEIQVDGNKLLKDSHAIAHEVHDKVEEEFPDMKHIMIHVNPAEDKQCGV